MLWNTKLPFDKTLLILSPLHHVIHGTDDVLDPCFGFLQVFHSQFGFVLLNSFLQYWEQGSDQVGTRTDTLWENSISHNSVFSISVSISQYLLFFLGILSFHLTILFFFPSKFLCLIAYTCKIPRKKVWILSKLHFLYFYSVAGIRFHKYQSKILVDNFRSI